MKTAVNTAAGFAVEFSNGRKLCVHTPGVEGYDEAVALARSEGAVEVGHDGDLERGGDRTLCWASEADARDDDGARALCKIIGNYDV